MLNKWKQFFCIISIHILISIWFKMQIFLDEETQYFKFTKGHVTMDEYVQECCLKEEKDHFMERKECRVETIGDLPYAYFFCVLLTVVI